MKARDIVVGWPRPRTTVPSCPLHFSLTSALGIGEFERDAALEADHRAEVDAMMQEYWNSRMCEAMGPAAFLRVRSPWWDDKIWLVRMIHERGPISGL